MENSRSFERSRNVSHYYTSSNLIFSLNEILISIIQFLAFFQLSKHFLYRWYDGFSTFYVGNDGKIFKHVADKMMPDQDTVIPKTKLDVAAKLAASMFVGIENLKQIFPGASYEISNLANLLKQRYKRGNIQKEPC